MRFYSQMITKTHRRRPVTAALTGRLLAAIAALGLTQPLYASGITELDADEVYAILQLDTAELDQLRQQQIINIDRPDLEQSERELVVTSMMVLDKPLPDIITALRNDVTFTHADMTIDWREIHSPADFDHAVLTQSEFKEVNYLLRKNPANQFNLSEQELQQFAKIRAIADSLSDTEKLERVNHTYRNILRERYHVYRRQGLNGIAPYIRKKGAMLPPGEELRLASESMGLIERHFPQFYQTLLTFPDAGHEFEQRFFWVKNRVEKRPTFILTHRMADIGDNYALIMERQYYVGHTYNSLQIIIGWLDDQDDNTFVGLVNSVSTDKVAAFGNLGRTIGRKRVEQQLVRLLEDIRAELGAHQTQN